MVMMNGDIMVLHSSIPCDQWWNTQPDNVGSICRLLHTPCRGHKGECCFKYSTLDCSRSDGGIFPFCLAFSDFLIIWNRYTGSHDSHDCRFVPWIFRDRTELIGSQMSAFYNWIPILYHYFRCRSSHINFLIHCGNK